MYQGCNLTGVLLFNTLTSKKMIKVLFKSEDLLVAADTESKVVYGNTLKNTVIELLSNLTPKNSKEAISIIMLIILLTTSKYVTN